MNLAELHDRIRRRCRSRHWWHLVPIDRHGDFQTATARVLRIAAGVIGLKRTADGYGGGLYGSVDRLLLIELEAHRGQAWADLLITNPRLRKLILAGVLTWLRAQFPVLNAAAVAGIVSLAANLLQETD